MNMHERSSWRSACALTLAALGVASTAPLMAQDKPACKDLENPVYVVGSSAAKPFIGAIAAELRQHNPPINVVYANPTGSCAGVDAIVADGELAGDGTTWDNDAKEVAGGCDVAGNKIDVALSDVWASTCDSNPDLGSGIKDFLGPIQTMTFVAPAQSNQNAISARAAYLVFGLAERGEVEPWTDPTQLFVRSASSGTQQMISKAIKLPASRFLGQSQDSGSKVLAQITSPMTDAQKGLGILAADAITEMAKMNLKILAYKHYGQDAAYWPDSDANSFDKINVRDGHYPIWGPLHILAKVEGGEITKESAKTFVDYLSGADTSEFATQLITLEAKRSVVPACAMHVARTEDGGAQSCVQPEKDCTCKFLEGATGTAPEECKTCSSNDECTEDGRSVCNYGFCEVK